MAQSPGYLERLRVYGYRTGDDMAQQAIAAQREQAAEKERLTRELPLLRTRGTRVCQRQGGIIFVGFVEDTAETKLKINVQQAYYMDGLGQQGARAPNYRAETVWDPPERWRVCE